MKEQPILFSGEMVRAILEGRKTQTRRKVRRDVFSLPGFDACPVESWMSWEDPDTGITHEITSPYGQPGDRLWVRETHCLVPAFRNAAGDRWSVWSGLPVTLHPTKDEAAYYREGFDRTHPARWRPSIHMPRWASRITLEVTSVRAQRLHDISEADAIAEGLKSVSKDGSLYKWGIPDADGLPGTDDHGWPWREWEADPRRAYARLWERINGAGSWDANPWVWVVGFRRVEP